MRVGDRTGVGGHNSPLFLDQPGRGVGVSNGVLDTSVAPSWPYLALKRALFRLNVSPALTFQKVATDI